MLGKIQNLAGNVRNTVRKGVPVRARGQAIVEFLIVAGMIIASLAILVLFLGAFREYGVRIVELAASEYP